MNLLIRNKILSSTHSEPVIGLKFGTCQTILRPTMCSSSCRSKWKKSWLSRALSAPTESLILSTWKITEVTFKSSSGCQTSTGESMNKTPKTWLSKRSRRPTFTLCHSTQTKIKDYWSTSTHFRTKMTRNLSTDFFASVIPMRLPRMRDSEPNGLRRPSSFTESSSHLAPRSHCPP